MIERQSIPGFIAFSVPSFHRAVQDFVYIFLFHQLSFIYNSHVFKCTCKGPKVIARTAQQFFLSLYNIRLMSLF